MNLLAPGRGAVPQSTRPVHLGSGTVDVPVYDRGLLGTGDRFNGPAIVTQLDATTSVPPGWAAEVHASGAILLTAG
jgi:N-methylhydantoinase A